VILIETVGDALAFMPKDPSKLGFVTQTTLSVDDTASIIDVLRQRFPMLEAPAAESICYATTNRQEAVKAAAIGSDYFLIVGAPNSSNSKRLVEVAERAGAKKAVLVQRAADINWAEMRNANIVGLSAGASAPEIIIDEIIVAFRNRFSINIELAETVVENETFLVNRELRDVTLTASDMQFVSGNRSFSDLKGRN